jgi:hypothetical protein
MNKNAAHDLIKAMLAMHSGGTPLMHLVLPPDVEPEQWVHYPADDAISPHTACRYFYHCHPPEERSDGEHGHFHLFLPLNYFPENGWKSAPANDGQDRADVVHLVALSVDMHGVPLNIFTTNRWVTDEWLYAAHDIATVIDRFDMTGAQGDPLVNQWLTSFVALARDPILNLLKERDALLATKNWPGDDKTIEITASQAVNLQSLIDLALA